MTSGLDNLGVSAFGRSTGMRTRCAVPGLPEQRLQGVDLRLDQFDLTTPKRVPLEAPLGSWGENADSLDACIAVGDTFWSSIGENSKVFNKEDSSLLRAVFCNGMSDR